MSLRRCGRRSGKSMRCPRPHHGRSRRPGEAGQGRFWDWGWDEITWFSQQPENARNDWLRYAWNWVREHEPVGYVIQYQIHFVFPTMKSTTRVWSAAASG